MTIAATETARQVLFTLRFRRVAAEEMQERGIDAATIAKWLNEPETKILRALRGHAALPLETAVKLAVSLDLGLDKQDIETVSTSGLNVPIVVPGGEHFVFYILQKYGLLNIDVQEFVRPLTNRQIKLLTLIKHAGRPIFANEICETLGMLERQTFAIADISTPLKRMVAQDLLLFETRELEARSGTKQQRPAYSLSTLGRARLEYTHLIRQVQLELEAKLNEMISDLI